MRQLTKTRLFKPISLEEINSFDIQNNFKLPNYLKEFFFNYNGSKIEENSYFFNGIEYIVSFLPLLKNKFDTSVEVILPFVQSEEMGVGRYDLIPFAIDPGGRIFLVSIGGKDEGVIYYSIVGLGEDEPLRKIADSFEEFIDGLRTEEEI
jgi:hypothetical protein